MPRDEDCMDLRAVFGEILPFARCYQRRELPRWARKPVSGNCALMDSGLISFTFLRSSHGGLGMCYGLCFEAFESGRRLYKLPCLFILCWRFLVDLLSFLCAMRLYFAPISPLGVLCIRLLVSYPKISEDSTILEHRLSF
jgi:hypothetical protein